MAGSERHGHDHDMESQPATAACVGRSRACRSRRACGVGGASVRWVQMHFLAVAVVLMLSPSWSWRLPRVPLRTGTPSNVRRTLPAASWTTPAAMPRFPSLCLGLRRGPSLLSHSNRVALRMVGTGGGGSSGGSDQGGAKAGELREGDASQTHAASEVAGGGLDVDLAAKPDWQGAVKDSSDQGRAREGELPGTQVGMELWETGRFCSNECVDVWMCGWGWGVMHACNRLLVLVFVVCVCARARVRARVRACVRACVRPSVRVYADMFYIVQYIHTYMHACREEQEGGGVLGLMEERGEGGRRGEEPRVWMQGEGGGARAGASKGVRGA